MQTLNNVQKDVVSRLIFFASTNSICCMIITYGVRHDIHRLHHIVTDVAILVRFEVIDKVDAFIIIDERINNNYMLWIVKR